MDDVIEVDVVYAGPIRLWQQRLRLQQGACVGDAIEASTIRQSCPEAMIDADHVGVFGRRVSLQHPLQSGDRVEIYRDLALDPMQARRERARHDGT